MTDSTNSILDPAAEASISLGAPIALMGVRTFRALQALALSLTPSEGDDEDAERCKRIARQWREADPSAIHWAHGSGKKPSGRAVKPKGTRGVAGEATSHGLTQCEITLPAAHTAREVVAALASACIAHVTRGKADTTRKDARRLAGEFAAGAAKSCGVTAGALATALGDMLQSDVPRDSAMRTLVAEAETLGFPGATRKPAAKREAPAIGFALADGSVSPVETFLSERKLTGGMKAALKALARADAVGLTVYLEREGAVFLTATVAPLAAASAAPAPSDAPAETVSAAAA